MVTRTFSLAMCAAVSIALAPAPVAAQLGDTTKEKPGKGGSSVQGSAGTEGSKGDSGLEHCDKPMGAMAVVEPQSEYMVALQRYNLGSPVGLIRLMIQQSNCFVVVERGQGLRNMEQERALAAGGQTRAGSNIGGGQMVAADYILTPAIVFSDNNAGGVGAAAAGIFGRKVGAIAGGLKFKEAQTSMLLADSRSGVQVAAAEGSTKKADLRAAGGVFGGAGGAALGGYASTDEGKIIAAALLDNYNQLVGAVRKDPSLQRNIGSLKEEAAAGGTRKAGAVFNEGDTLSPKIAGVKVLAAPAETAKVVVTLGRTDEMVVVGEEKDGYIEVETASGKGWVRMTLVQKH
jgi:hypothetical protein